MEIKEFTNHLKMSGIGYVDYLGMIEDELAERWKSEEVQSVKRRVDVIGMMLNITQRALAIENSYRDTDIVEVIAQSTSYQNVEDLLDSDYEEDFEDRTTPIDKLLGRMA